MPVVRTILLVDSETHVRHMISYKLRCEGLITHLAADTDEALKILDEFPIDLMMMDIALPTPAEGFEFAQQVRQRDNPICDLPIIILSAQCSEADIRCSNEIAASGYITKPFSLSFVIRKIKAIVSN